MYKYFNGWQPGAVAVGGFLLDGLCSGGFGNTKQPRYPLRRYPLVYVRSLKVKSQEKMIDMFHSGRWPRGDGERDC